MHANRSLKRGLLSVALCATALVGPIVVEGSAAHAVVPGVDGQVLFTRQICQTDTDPCWEIVVTDATDTQETVVAGPYERGVWDDHFIANWSPDGRSLIFMADLGTGQAIWQVNADGSNFHQVFAPPADGTGLDDGPAFTPDGRWIIFTRCCPQPSGYGLWRVHPDGTGVRIVTTETIGAHMGDVGASDNLPEVSPDGRTILFHRNSDANRVATVNFAGGNLRELTPGDLDGQIPNWSPDGRRIVFQGFTDAGVDVWAVNPDGTGLSNLTNDGISLNPSYSPDGTKIIFGRVMGDGSRDLFTMNPDGSDITQLTHTSTSERFPQWAPAT